MKQKPNEKRPPHLLLSPRTRTVLAEGSAKNVPLLRASHLERKRGTKDVVDEVWAQLMLA